MKPTVKILDHDHIPALLELSAAEGFPCELTAETARRYCRGKAPADEGVATYGVFEEDYLVSVMTATFCMVFPCKDSPTGRIVHISGAYTLPASRSRGYASDLLRMIEEDARSFGADYLCCDSIADGLYLHNGFEPTSDDETRMWKRISLHKEELL